MTDKEILQKAFSHVRAPEKCLSTVMERTAERKNDARVKKARFMVSLMIVVAVCITAITYATYIYSLTWRMANENERYQFSIINDIPLFYETPKIVFTFEGPEKCHVIRFKPGYLPFDTKLMDEKLSIVDSNGWFTRLSGESTGFKNQPCLIEVYYAPQFLNNGQMILVRDSPGNISEEIKGDYQVLKFHSITPLDEDSNYILLLNQIEGFIIVVAGECDIDVLERVAADLTIMITDDVIFASDYKDRTVAIDWGLG